MIHQPKLTLKTSILLVDDDDDDVFFFKDALSEISTRCTLLHAPNGVEALKILDEMNPETLHCIFLDLNMPLMDGFECLEKIKARKFLKRVPVIILTTSTDSKSMAKSIRSGADAFFTKPATVNDLKIIIESAITTVQ